MVGFLRFAVGAIVGSAICVALIVLLVPRVTMPGLSLSGPADRTDTTQAADVTTPQAETFSKGTFHETQRGLLTPPTPDRFQYEPSELIARQSQQHNTGGLEWHSLLPAGASPAPVVVLLHGANRTGLSMLDMWQRVGRSRDVVLIAPDAPGGSWAGTDLTAERIAAMLDSVAQRRPIDRERIYLFGHSNGAVLAALLVNRGVGPWRAAALHGGIGSPDHYRRTAAAPPIRIYLGERDHIFSPESVRVAAAALSEAGHDTELHLIPGHTHWFYEIGPRVAADAWTWFQGVGPGAER